MAEGAAEILFGYGLGLVTGAVAFFTGGPWFFRCRRRHTHEPTVGEDH